MEKTFKYSGAFDDLYITKVIYAKPHTIVFWSDGTKSKACCGSSDSYDREKGLLVAIFKKLRGFDQLERLIDEWVPQDITLDCVHQEVTLSDVRRYKRVQSKVD